MKTVAYPRLIRRIQAVLIDSVLVPVAVFATVLLGGTFGVSHTAGKVMLLLAPVFILEPGLVAFTGGTVGHHLVGIRVTKPDGVHKINIVAATIRFVVKVLFGWLSFIFVLVTAKHQAMHDLAVRSIVTHKSIEGLPAYDVLAERTLDRTHYVYPSAWRRVAVIIGYAILATIALSVGGAMISSTACIETGRCTTADTLFQIVLNMLWLLGLGWIAVRAWNGKLYGCRRRPCQ